MQIRAWLIGGAVACALSLTTWREGQGKPTLPQPVPKSLPQPVPESQPQPVPKSLPQSQSQRGLPKLANPAGTAKAVAALARFANNQLGQGSYDRRVGKVLGKLPGAKDTAKRLIQAIEGMSATDRGKAFPGFGKAGTVTLNQFEPIAYTESAAARWGKVLAPATTVLAPDPYDAANKAAYELVYSGFQCTKTADADGTDEAVVYLNVMTGAGAYASAPKYIPDTGTAVGTAAAVNPANAGQVWSSATWPGGWSSGLVMVTGVLEDNGDLDKRKQELELLVAFAQSETEEDNVTPDRAEVLRRELADALALLNLANPDRWSAKAIQVRKLTSTEYDALYTKPSTVTPVKYKLTAQHDPRGGDYTLYFDIPPPNVTTRTVFVTIKEVEALGADKDAAQNKLADLGATVSINGNTVAEASRVFSANKNLVKPDWVLEREVLAGRTVSVGIEVFDDDPAPDCACTSFGGWPVPACFSYCALPDKKDTCAGLAGTVGYGYGASYSGQCPHQQVDYDVNPLPDSGDGWFYSEYHDISFTFDLATAKIAGDVNGSPGTYTVFGTDGAGNRARVVFEVGTR
jgi:hypothetical protein